MAEPQFILVFSCPNRPGIVFAVSRHLYEHGANIQEAQQFDDGETGRFFMRVVFNFVSGHDDIDRLKAGFRWIADAHGMEWTLRPRAQLFNVLLLASRSDHCLADLLYRWRTGQLAMNLTGIVSNHPRSMFDHLQIDDIRFHHLPVDAATKAAQEAAIWRIIMEREVELVVLARYMQILSDGFAGRLSGRCINIHHSFLPGFKGAKPYHQAHARGVKLIGATAHYVTAQLDEGPIIEQDVERISHQDTPEDLIRKGSDIERRVLARAVGLHLDLRVATNGNRTVVFRD